MKDKFDLIDYFMVFAIIFFMLVGTLSVSAQVVNYDGELYDVVYSEDESWAAADCTKKELNEWLETLNTNQFKQVEEFFETMPKLSHTVKVTNPKTKVESDVKLEGLTSFFG